MATSGSFNTNSVGNFYFTVAWNRTGYSSEYNEHYIYYEVVAHNTPGNYRTVYLKSLTINGTSQYYSTSGTTCYDGTVITSGSITISSYNASGDGSIALNFEAGVGISSGSNCNGSGSWNLDRIPRYANFTEHYIYATGLNSITVHWNADAGCDWVQYSLNGGGWTNTSGLTYTISGLTPNTQYNIRTRIKRTDSQLWTESGYIYGTTKDIAKITSAPNLNLGNSETVQYTNPSGNTIKLSIQNIEGTIIYCADRTVTSNSYTFNFTDTELDALFKAMGASNSLNVKVYLKTFYSGSSYYTNYKQITITLTGNQKTGHINVSDSWKRTKKWVNVGGTWKRCVRWVNVGGTWKRCI